MNKYQFLSAVREGLDGMSSREIDESLAYYREMIEDRVEEGLSEEDAVKALGPVEKVIADIKNGTDGSESREKVTPVLNSEAEKEENGECTIIDAAKTIGRVFWIITEVFAWIVLVSVMITGISVGVAAVGSLLGGIVYIFTDGFAGGMLLIGGGIACAGIGIITVAGIAAAMRGMNKLSGLIMGFLRKKEDVEK